MRRRWTLRVELRDDINVTHGWRGGEILRNAGVKAIWSASERGWVADARRAADVLAAIEASGAAVVISGLRRPEPQTVAAPLPEPTLFDGGWPV